MKALLFVLSLLVFLSQNAIAKEHPPLIAPQPINCVQGELSASGSPWWKDIVIKLTNNCTQVVDFQNSTVTFESGIPVNTSFWGEFAPLSYPLDSSRTITSQQQTAGNYLATLRLQFPTGWGTTKLPVGNSIYIKYGASNEANVPGSTKVYVSGTVDTGNIQLTNATAKPANVQQNYAVVHVTLGGQKISDVQLPWNSTQTLSGLASGNYMVAADNVVDTSSNAYQGVASPSLLTLLVGQTVKSTITYTQVQQVGKLVIQLSALPSQLTGYLDKPVAVISQSGSGSSTSANLNWGTATTVAQLKNGSTYTFSTPMISFNGYQCKPTFTPTSLVANDATPPTTVLSYACTQVAKSNITTNVSGAPATLTSLQVTFTPNDSSASVVQTVPLQNGTGSSATSLTTNTIYNVSADAIAGYTVNFNPQPLTASPNATETITFTTGTPVSINGQLQVCGTKLCNQYGVPIQLKGMSTHGLQWYGLGNCLTQGSLDALANDWGANVIRLSMYVQEGGYETDPVAFTNQVNQLINEATKRGIYAIVDWHMLDPGDPNYNYDRAVRFFTDIATANKGKVNLLYEIANEPNGVNWSSIKSYAEKLIPIIRAIDPKTVIIVGTPGWSSLGISDGMTSQQIISNPVNATNIMYTFHFYAASHRDEYLNELDKASNSLPIFVTEWGTQTYSGDGANDFAMSDRYTQLMQTKKIGWTNWNYSDDFRSGAVWKTGTCASGTWTQANLKPAGVYVRGKIKS